jgi:hypothetical protein
MTSFITLLTQHRIACSAIALIGLIIGVMLTRRRLSVSLSAKSGGVVVGRDNSGFINTGTTEGSSTSDRVIAIVGAIIAAAGAVVALLAWWYPKTPA